MMRLLIVSATIKEIEPLHRLISGEEFSASEKDVCIFFNHEISWLITGVGGIATGVVLSAHLTVHRYDLVINLGIAGAFNRALAIGTVVQVREERFGDLGVEEADGSFLDLFSAGLAKLDEEPFANGVINAPHVGGRLPSVRAISVNKVHGNEKSIQHITEKYQPEIESMEGASFFYCCRFHRHLFIEIRAISNYVEKRNRDQWNIPLAISNLALVTKEFLEQLGR
ncbi:MAG: futalosine hydrolase [Saprospiraceae bacterium]|nr:futalosine hydrolase [Saprospiraceae bacterium]